MEEETNVEILKNKIKNAVYPKRTINLENLLKKLIEIDENKMGLKEIIYNVFPSDQSIPIKQNETTSQQFSSHGSQFINSSNQMDIDPDFNNGNNEGCEIIVDAKENDDYEDSINKIYALLQKCNNNTIENIFNEVKKELEPELTEVSKMENN